MQAHTRFYSDYDVMNPEVLSCAAMKKHPVLNKWLCYEDVLGNGGIARHVLNLGTRWKWAIIFTSRPLCSRGKSPRCPLDRRLDGPRSRSGHGSGEKKENPSLPLSLPEFEPWASSPDPSRCTDWETVEGPILNLGMKQAGWLRRGGGDDLWWWNYAYRAERRGQFGSRMLGSSLGRLHFCWTIALPVIFNLATIVPLFLQQWPDWTSCSSSLDTWPHFNGASTHR
jgi:hypothetical protein